jgi:hypothetical protein
MAGAARVAGGVVDGIVVEGIDEGGTVVRGMDVSLFRGRTASKSSKGGSLRNVGAEVAGGFGVGGFTLAGSGTGSLLAGVLKFAPQFPFGQFPLAQFPFGQLPVLQGSPQAPQGEHPPAQGDHPPEQGAHVLHGAHVEHPPGAYPYPAPQS